MGFELRGVFAAMVTPFKEDESIDEEALRRETSFLVEAGVHGLVACSIAGEATLMSIEERKHVIRVIVEEAKGVPVVAECGCARTKDSIELAGFSERVGAAAVLVTGPWFYPQRPQGLRGYFEAVVQATKLPSILGNFPQHTSNQLEPGLVEALAHRLKLAGLVDGSGDLMYLQRLRAEVEELSLGCWAGEVIYPSLCLGASACVTPLAACAPKLVLELYSSFLKRDLERCKELQLKLLELSLALKQGPPVQGQKFIQELQGRVGGRARMPLGSLSGVDRIALRKSARGAGLI